MIVTSGERRIIGREEELAAVERFLESVPEGPRALLIEGDPGIGKTTVWSEGVAAARGRLHWILSCRPAEAETSLAFSALGDLLEPVLEETLPQLPTPQRRALEVAVLRADAESERAEPRAVSLAVLGVLRLLARLSPVLVAIDDLQWLDAPSARVLAFALRRLEQERVGVLATRRTSPEVPLDLDAVVAGDVHTVIVAPLSSGELRRILEHRLGAILTPPTLKRVEESAGGNPLFALELGRAVLDGRIELTGSVPPPLPRHLLELVRGRLVTLAAENRRVLAVAAALSQPTVRHVAAAAGRTRTTSALREAAEAGVVDIEDDRVRFTHPLFASALYGELAPADRRRLHRKIAAVVPELEERARHLALAAEAPDEAVASTLLEAARRVAARGAPDEAAILAAEAVRLTPADRAGEQATRQVETARFALAAGDTLKARSLLEAAVGRMPPGPDRARALQNLAVAINATEGTANGSKDLYEQALREAGDDLALRASIERALATFWVLADDVRAAGRHAHAALEAADQLGDSDVLARALATAAHLDFMLGRGIAWDKIERSLALYDDNAASSLGGHPGLSIAPLLETAMELAPARSLLERLERKAVEHGEERLLPFVLGIRSAVECAAGEYDRAIAYARDGVAVAKQTTQPGLVAMALYGEAAALAHLGRVDAVRAAAEEGRELAAQTGSNTIAGDGFAGVLGFLELSLGNARAAHEHFAPLPEQLVHKGLREPTFFFFVPDDVEALVSLGELDAARRLLDEQERRARAVGRPWALATCARCSGLVAAAAGDLAGAREHLARALLEHERLPMPFERARTLLVRGTLERRAKRRRAARESLEEAVAIFDQLGTDLWAEKARGELARIGGRARGGDDLTPTEERVAQLVAEGRTNREVAETLFMSVKTVEANLSRIYGKLGVRSRTELAARIGAGRPAAGKK